VRRCKATQLSEPGITSQARAMTTSSDEREVRGNEAVNGAPASGAPLEASDPLAISLVQSRKRGPV
jgi:hypothetical protein